MTPHDFVETNLKNGGEKILVENLRDFYSTMRSPDDLQSFEIRSFAKAFVMGLIQQLGNGECSDEELRSAYVKIWKDCGYFGIDRRKIE